MTAPRKVWTPDAVRGLGVRTDVPTAGEILAGLCRTESYQAVKRGTFPVPVLKVGCRLVVPVQPILDLLGIAAPDNGAGGTSPEAPPANTAEPSPKGTTDDQRKPAA